MATKHETTISYKLADLDSREYSELMSLFTRSGPDLPDINLALKVLLKEDVGVIYNLDEESLDKIISKIKE